MRPRALAAIVIAAAIAGIAGGIEQLKPVTELSGHPRIVDGDTLAFGERRVRLVGIDAPELEQTCIPFGPCGRETARRLAAFIGGEIVTCAGRKRDRFDRLLATCTRGEDEINSWLVARGLARAAREHIDYAALERRARREKLGWWAGTWDDPAEFRERHPR